MKARIIDGRATAKKVKAEVKAVTDVLRKEDKRPPCLSVILAGEDPASAIYVRNKEKACKANGILSVKHALPEDVSAEKLEEVIRALNEDERVDGILLQLPLPDHLNDRQAYFLNLIRPDKDVDGFHPLNVGRLTLGLDAPVACTPYGCMRLLEETGEDLEGKLALVIGRSNTVGKPMIQLLLQKNATVIVAHSRTKNLPELSRQADIIIAAVGQSEFLSGDMVKEGVIVIDVGINRQENGKLLGDVNFPEVSEKASYITTVPGGVGPMTVAMLLKNTLKCYEMHNLA